MYLPPPGRPQSTPPDEPNYQSTVSGKPKRRPGEKTHEYATRVHLWMHKNDPEWARKFSAKIRAVKKSERAKHLRALSNLNKSEKRGIWMIGQQLVDVGVFTSNTSIYYRARVEGFEVRELRGIKAFLIPHDSDLMRRYRAAIGAGSPPAPPPAPPVAVERLPTQPTFWQRFFGWFNWTAA